MCPLETNRLGLRQLTLDDAAFVLALVNEPGWLRFIGDRGVHTPEDARRYLENGPFAAYARSGYGHYLVERKADGAALGICGIVKREALEEPDLGFAFFERHWGQGYAEEASVAVLAHARGELGLLRVCAITAPDNVSSIRLLGKLGFRFERVTRLVENGPESRLYLREM